MSTRFRRYTKASSKWSSGYGTDIGGDERYEVVSCANEKRANWTGGDENVTRTSKEQETITISKISSVRVF